MVLGEVNQGALVGLLVQNSVFPVVHFETTVSVQTLGLELGCQHFGAYSLLDFQDRLVSYATKLSIFLFIELGDSV